MKHHVVCYVIDLETATAKITAITDRQEGMPKPEDYTWVKIIDAEDELGAYLAFVKWFEETHPLTKLYHTGA